MVCAASVLRYAHDAIFEGVEAHSTSSPLPLPRIAFSGERLTRDDCDHQVVLGCFLCRVIGTCQASTVIEEINHDRQGEVYEVHRNRRVLLGN